MKELKKERPSKFDIEEQSKILEKYLGAQGWKISLSVREEPIVITHRVNKGEPWEQWSWYESVTVTSNSDEKIEFDACECHLNDDFNEWHQAFFIQDQFYMKENRFAAAHKNRSDAYWKLWDHIG